MTSPLVRYRAQVRAADGKRWVDGGLYVRLSDAERDADAMREAYNDNETRVIEVPS